LQRKFVI